MSRWYVPIIPVYTRERERIDLYRLLNYSPPAVLIRLLATNGLIAYLTSSVLWLSGASSDPRLLLPAWISITTVLPPFPPYLLSVSPTNSDATDINFPLPRNPEPRHDQTRNHRVDISIVCSELCEHVFDIIAVAFDAG